MEPLTTVAQELCHREQTKQNGNLMATLQTIVESALHDTLRWLFNSYLYSGHSFGHAVGLNAIVWWSCDTLWELVMTRDGNFHERNSFTLILLPNWRYFSNGVIVMPKMSCRTIIDPCVWFQVNNKPRQSLWQMVIGLPIFSNFFLGSWFIWIMSTTHITGRGSYQIMS